MAMEVDAENVLITLREEIETVDPELAAQFYTLEDYYERKLWYQLSEALKNDIFKNENSKTIRLKLFDNFISLFSDKINQLQLVEFLVVSLSETSPQDSFEYLTNLKQKVTKLNDKRKSTKFSDKDTNDYEIIQSLIYLENELANVKLQLGFIDEANNIIEQSQSKMDNLSISVDDRVSSSYYLIKAKLMKVKGDFNSFYYNSLLFLACVPNLDDLNNKDEIVKDICIGGLLGDKIFNFGEIIMHDIFKYLKNDWLKQLLLSLNNGDLKSFNELIDKPQLNEFADISTRIEFLKQKICIMAFIELVFNKPTTSRCIKYDEILKNIPLLKTSNEIEYLVMRCLSLGLIKGLINQVEENVEVSWIQPRIMTHDQIESMKNKVSVWNEKVASLSQYMGVSGGELFA